MYIALIFTLAFVCITYWLQQRSKKKALDGIEYKREAPHMLNAPGEPFTLVTTVTNAGWRVVPLVEVHEKLDEIHHNFKAYLLPRSKLVRRATVSLPKRGRYIFSNARVGGGDFLGIEQVMRDFKCWGEVIIHPEKAEGDYISHALGNFLGDISVSRFIAPDPILVTGFSEYTGREPMRDISWPQTLRAGQMMVKKYDYTTELSATVVISLEYLSDTNHKLPYGAAEQIEKCMSIAYAVCSALDAKKIKYDLYSNMIAHGHASSWDHVPEGYGKAHLSHILEGMGRASLLSSETLDNLVKRVAMAQMHSSNKSIIFVVPNHEDRARKIIEQAGSIRSFSIISAERHEIQ